MGVYIYRHVYIKYISIYACACVHVEFKSNLAVHVLYNIPRLGSLRVDNTRYTSIYAYMHDAYIYPVHHAPKMDYRCPLVHFKSGGYVEVYKVCIKS